MSGQSTKKSPTGPVSKRQVAVWNRRKIAAAVAPLSALEKLEYTPFEGVPRPSTHSLLDRDGNPNSLPERDVDPPKEFAINGIVLTNPNAANRWDHLHVLIETDYWIDFRNLVFHPVGQIAMQELLGIDSVRLADEFARLEIKHGDIEDDLRLLPVPGKGYILRSKYAPDYLSTMTEEQVLQSRAGRHLLKWSQSTKCRPSSSRNNSTVSDRANKLNADPWETQRGGMVAKAYDWVSALHYALSSCLGRRF